MRVAVVDIGTNSTRLLIADVGPNGTVTDLERRSVVTRLGQGVDKTGVLANDAMQRVYDVLSDYQRSIAEQRVEATTAVLTSAVRDASNGNEFTAMVAERFGLDARTITGDEEANLSFIGATSERPPDGARLVLVDIGGGSTEFVVGSERIVDFHVSTQAGVVRHTERFLHSDPPNPEELQLLTTEIAEIFAVAVPEEIRSSVDAGIAVAGTATQTAAIIQSLEPYDTRRVHGFRLLRAQCEEQLSRLAQLTEQERRRNVTGLDPARAPTIVAGIVLLIEAMKTFHLNEVKVSEHDILRGAALARAGLAAGGTDKG